MSGSERHQQLGEERRPHHVLFLSDGDWIPARELSVRRALSFAFRLSLGAFVAAQLWDFLFSPIWMHGYLWALNQPSYAEQQVQSGFGPFRLIGAKASGTEKSALAILDQQLAQCGRWERAAHAALSTAGVWLLLRCAGFGRANRTAWALVRLALCCGGATGLTRAVQMRQRLLPCIHDFYAFLLIFLVGLCLSVRSPRYEALDQKRAEPIFGGRAQQTRQKEE